MNAVVFFSSLECVSLWMVNKRILSVWVYACEMLARVCVCASVFVLTIIRKGETDTRHWLRVRVCIEWVRMVKFGILVAHWFHIVFPSVQFKCWSVCIIFIWICHCIEPSANYHSFIWTVEQWNRNLLVVSNTVYVQYKTISTKFLFPLLILLFFKFK